MPPATYGNISSIKILEEVQRRDSREDNKIHLSQVSFLGCDPLRVIQEADLLLDLKGSIVGSLEVCLRGYVLDLRYFRFVAHFTAALCIDERILSPRILKIKLNSAGGLTVNINGNASGEEIKESLRNARMNDDQHSATCWGSFIIGGCTKLCRLSKTGFCDECGVAYFCGVPLTPGYEALLSLAEHGYPTFPGEFRAIALGILRANRLTSQPAEY
jgi:hypothetical protein